MEALNAAVKHDLQNNDTAAAAEKIKKYLEDQQNIPLNIAITGESGSGKSTFINAFREIDDEDEKAAITDVVEVSSEVTPYSQPNYPNVTFWDLPGIGTTRYPADEYLKLVGFEKFDFFIIISDTRFKENAVKLIQEIQRMEKKFYFVRSKTDNDLRAAQRKTGFSEEKTLTKIRKDSFQSLQRQGIKSPQVFLVSSFDLRLFDFPLLHQTLKRELPGQKTELFEQKRDALLFAMPNISLEIINNKKEVCQSKVKYYSILSAVVAGVPVPGLSAAVDIGLMVKVVTGYLTAFGLDKSSLERLARRTGVPYVDLCAVIQSPLAADEISADLLLKVLSQLACTAAFMTVEEGARWIPAFGIVASMTLSFTVSYRALSYFLKTLSEDAQRVFKRALNVRSNE